MWSLLPGTQYCIILSEICAEMEIFNWKKRKAKFSKIWKLEERTQGPKTWSVYNTKWSHWYLTSTTQDLDGNGKKPIYYTKLLSSGRLWSGSKLLQSKDFNSTLCLWDIRVSKLTTMSNILFSINIYREHDEPLCTCLETSAGVFLCGGVQWIWKAFNI